MWFHMRIFRRMVCPLMGLGILLCLILPALSADLNAAAVNNAQYTSKRASKDKLDPAVIKAEILLDRAL
jgi:hypothetical protein